MLAGITETLGTALVGAVFAVLGFFGKALLDWRRDSRAAKAVTVGRLQQLMSLLDASKAVFHAQKAVLHRLMDLLQANHKDQFRPGGGMEENLARCHAAMNEKERELHGIARTYTEHSMRTLNGEMLAWLKADNVFKCGIAPVLQPRELADELFALEIHLQLWHAKYEAWIPGHPEHAVVYMHDEDRHGLGFPLPRTVDDGGRKRTLRGVDAEVRSALEELRTKWKLNPSTQTP